MPNNTSTIDDFVNRPLGRRSLIRKGLAIVAGAGMAAATPPAFVRAAFDADTTNAEQKRILVVVQLGGGNDGLNTLVPYTDGAYFDARKDVALDPEELLYVDDRLALHSSLGSLKNIYDRGDLGVILGVGYPKPNRSHFRSMDIWHTGSTDVHETTGWLGRFLDATHHEQNSLWRAANIGKSLSMALDSNDSFVPSLKSVPAYVLQTDPRKRSQEDRRVQDWLQLQSVQTAALAKQAEYGSQLAFVSETGISAYQSTIDLHTNVSDYTPSVKYPKTPLGSALETASQLINSDTGTGVVYVTTGGFDTHAIQTSTQSGLLGSVSDSLGAFQEDLEAHDVADNVITLVWTEFGRRVNANGSGGTDHGTAGPAFLMGKSVNGGLHGEQPSLTKLDDGKDLRYTTDFRSIYTTLLSHWFETDPTDVISGKFPELPLFSAE
tara:strand:- start:2064 stop:3371 length:1308 start_codon:yes stop_codon:yes gene_type:complete